jgi:membrane protein DedA with SNARE-associated domain
MLDQLIAASPYVGLLITLLIAGLGVPIPEEVPIVTAGILAHREVVHWWLALPICLFGVFVGDLSLYAIGRRFGDRALDLRLVRRLLTPARRDKLEGAYRRRGIIIVFGARHVAGVRGAAFLTAGIMKLSAWKFVLADGLAVLLGVPISFTLAYLFSERVHHLLAEMHRVELWLAVLAVLGVGIWLFVSARRRAVRNLGPDVVAPEPEPPPE